MTVKKEDLIWYGRNLDHDGIRYFDYSASGFCFVLKGKKAIAHILSNPDFWDEIHRGVLGVFISEGQDCSWASLPEEPARRITLNEKDNECLLFESDKEKTVTIRVIKLSEAAFGYAGLKSLEIDGQLLPAARPVTKLNLEIIGDSITCGYGIEGVFLKDSFTTQQERADKSYAFLTAKGLNANLQNCSWSGIGIISNYVDPPTATLPDTHWLMPANWPYTDKSLSLRLGLEPEIWDGSKFVPDIVLVHLGTNDQSWVNGHEDRRVAFVSGYRQLLEAINRRSPSAKICCTLGVMGEALNDSVEEAVGLFKKDFPAVKTKVVKLKQQDETDGLGTDWHPSAVTHRKVADVLIRELKDY